MKMKIVTILCCTGVVLSGQILSGQLKLPALISDGMVIQRDAEVKIWGRADPGKWVRVAFDRKSYRTRAGEDGKWKVFLQPMKAGGPYEMEVTSGETVRIGNIMVGDVWLCAGQSNMVHYLDLHRDRYAEEIACANHPEIRQFLVPANPDLQVPAGELTGGDWKAAVPGDIGRFSVVAYFFARMLHDTYGIPVGIINASVGGTPIEAWTSSEGLREFPGLQETLLRNRDTAFVDRINGEALAGRREQERKREEDRGMAGGIAWFDTSYVPVQWRTIAVPGYWEDQGVRGLDGVVWYRKTFRVPSSMAWKPAKLALGRIVDADEAYINGRMVGRTDYQYPQRRYEVQAGIMKPGMNTIVVRVSNFGGKGGFVPDKPYLIATDRDTIRLDGYWKYEVGAVYPGEGPVTLGISAQNQPSALFNGMIAPVTDFSIKGFVWYQGESNAGDPAGYRELLPALIRDWRDQWGAGDLPFIYAQLPNFMEVNYLPEESNWAMLREAQLKALELPATGMAVTIDLGEWNDIHPGNKKPVGERLALAARRVAYGESDLVHSGPVFRSHTFSGNRIILSFGSTGSGLTSCDGGPLRHFAIAGQDGKFRWANAVIEGETVVVWHDRVPDPVCVRYAWADNPDSANLCNLEGLPASPFRTCNQQSR